jgi:hypothetical protein
MKLQLAVVVGVSSVMVVILVIGLIAIHFLTSTGHH